MGPTTESLAASSRVETAVAVLRSRGERVTRVRLAVLEVLDGTDEHLSADEIVRRAEESAPGLHRASVYRALTTLGELGLVSHTHLGGAAAVHHLQVDRPEAPATAGHAHLQCTSCSRVIDIPVVTLRPLAETIEQDFGFTLEPQHAALLGVCADCR